MKKIKIALAGATGWVGSSLVKAIHESKDFELVNAIALDHHGHTVGQILGIEGIDLIVSNNLKQELQKSDAEIFIDFTSPSGVKKNVLTALEHGKHVIIGTSGLTDADYKEINLKAKENNCGVIAAGNFSLTAALMNHFSKIAARFIPEWEIIDYASSKKPDAPSGTARELAENLSSIKSPHIEIPIDKTYGSKQARGADINGTQVHSVRLPCYILATEIIFGKPEEKLILYHEAGNSPLPYIAGVLLAVRKVRSIVGLVRGFDMILEV